MQGTGLTGAVLANADFSCTDGNSCPAIEGVNFGGAVLQGADFSGALLQSIPGGSGVSFVCSKLGGANFNNASVSSTSFSEAVMPGQSDCCPAEGGADLRWSVTRRAA